MELPVQALLQRCGASQSAAAARAMLQSISWLLLSTSPTIAQGHHRHQAPICEQERGKKDKAGGRAGTRQCQSNRLATCASHPAAAAGARPRLRLLLAPSDPSTTEPPAAHHTSKQQSPHTHTQQSTPRSSAITGHSSAQLSQLSQFSYYGPQFSSAITAVTVQLVTVQLAQYSHTAITYLSAAGTPASSSAVSRLAPSAA